MSSSRRACSPKIAIPQTKAIGLASSPPLKPSGSQVLKRRLAHVPFTAETATSSSSTCISTAHPFSGMAFLVWQVVASPRRQRYPPAGGPIGLLRSEDSPAVGPSADLGSFGRRSIGALNFKTTTRNFTSFSLSFLCCPPLLLRSLVLYEAVSGQTGSSCSGYLYV